MTDEGSLDAIVERSSGISRGVIADGIKMVSMPNTERVPLSSVIFKQSKPKAVSTNEWQGRGNP